MKILVVIKRFGTNKDSVMQNYGRQIRLFEHIKSLGHDVDFLCMDFVKLESKKVTINDIDYYIEPFGLIKYGFFNRFNILLKKNKYDLIVASTTPLIGIISYYYSRKYKIKMLYDLQDSFDSYDEYKIPLVKNLDGYILKNSDLVICVSETLTNKIKTSRKKQTYTIENGFEMDLFKSIPRVKARKMLKLPLKSKIIVYIGHMSKARGFDILYGAFEILRKKYKDIYLLVSGKVEKGININKPAVIFRKLPKRKDVVLAINAANVAVLPNPENIFTKYAFPYKMVEYMACKAPVVATNIGDVSELLKNYKDSLCKPDSRSMSEKIVKNLHKGKISYHGIEKYGWKNLSKKLNNILIKK